MNETTASLTRRQFVRRAACAAAVAPIVVPGAALGEEEKPAAGDRLALGFIGVGKQNRYHLSRFLGNNDVQVIAVCEVDKNRREHSKGMVDERYGNTDCAACDDHGELLARNDLDAVVIASPDHWHTIEVIDACKAGLDIYCEKPLTLTIHEAKLCIDAVRKHNVVFQTGSQQRSGREFRTACELVRNGRIGKLQKVLVGVGGPSKWCDLPEEEMEPGLDWDRWLGPAPMRPYNSILSPRGVHDHFPRWRAYREYSGGSMTDWGAHHFDIAQWGLGMDESGPVEIIPPENPEAGLGVTFVYDLGDDRVPVVHDGPSGITFIGEKGEVFVTRGKLTTKPEDIAKQPIGESEIHLYQSPGHHQDWLDCIKTRKRPICDVEIGARSVTVCHLGNLAYWHGKKLRWDPRGWRFLDEEDNKLLDHDRREGYQLPVI